MYTTRSFAKGVLSLSLVAVLSGYVLAAEQPGYQMRGESEQRETIQQEGLAGRTQGVMHRASEIMGKQVKNPQGEKLGTVHDIVLTEDRDAVSYLALSRGGIFGLGQTLHAVPWDAVQVGIDGEPYIVSITRQDLEQTRGFPSGNWPASVEKGWSLEDTERGAPTYRGYGPEESEVIQNRRFSRIRGTNVRTADGRSGGTVRDLIIATETGEITYTIVSLGGLFGLGAQYAAVPHDAVTYLPGMRTATVDASRETLQANAFSPGQFPNLADAAYARDIRQSYGMETGETVLGFVPAEEPERASEAARPQTDRRPGVQAPDTTRRAPAEGFGAVKMDPMAPFDPAAIKTVEGVVTMVGKYSHTEAAPDILMLQIREDNGNMHLVHAGPLNYVSKQDFYAVNGDRISVTGAPTPGESPIFLAARIAKDGQVLTLRNRDGKPLWERSPDTEQRPDTTTHAPEHHMEEAPRG